MVTFRSGKERERKRYLLVEKFWSSLPRPEQVEPFAECDTWLMRCQIR